MSDIGPAPLPPCPYCHSYDYDCPMGGCHAPRALINPEPLDEATAMGLRHHCPNCGSLDIDRDFRTDPGFLQIDVQRDAAEILELRERLAAAVSSLVTPGDDPPL